MTSNRQTEFIELLQTHVTELQINEHKATGHVPWRGDVHPSLTADLEKCVWYDLARKEGGGLKDFKARLGLNGAPQVARRIVARYNYKDENGTLLYQVLRDEHKKFLQRRPDGKGGWLYNLNDVRRVLYRLPELLSQKTVWIVEGEKDAERLWSLGLPATSNPGGAGKWRDEYSHALAGKLVVILPDNDQPGEQHAQHVARSVFSVAQSVRIVHLPDLPPKGDVSDWLDHSHTKNELIDLARATPVLIHADVHPAPRLALPEPSTQPPSGAASADERAPAPSWPVLAAEALHGLAGEIVRTIDPHTEADPVATLLNVLTAFGNCINATAHAKVQHDRHPARLFVVQVGDTSKGRKGTGWSTPRYLFKQIDPDWTQPRIQSGLSSGEGLIWAVRDPVYKSEAVKEKGRYTGEVIEVCTDQGEDDKRLLIVEPEFASVLTVADREKNTLSAILRQAWDGQTLSPLTKNNRIKATGAHVSILAHITRQELLARLDDTSKANGFANRFLWALVKRSKELPEGGAVPESALSPLIKRLKEAITFARTVSEVKRNEEAKAAWAAVYHDLSEGKPGLVGAVLSRAEAQVLRLSLPYALLDCSAVVRAEHLRAALAVWEYCERSALFIFGDSLGDPTADRILEALRTAGPEGMSERQIYDLFGGHKSTTERARSLSLLARLELATSNQEETGGRPRRVWRAAY